MPMSRAQIAAGITARFTPHVGGCWKILDRRVRVESRFLCAYRYIFEFSHTHTLGNHVPPLHHYECKEVHTLRLIKQVVRQRSGVVAELEGQRGERHAIPLQVPERPARIYEPLRSEEILNLAREKDTHMAMAQSDSRMPRKPYAWRSKRLLARRSFFTLRGGRESKPLSGGSKHMLNAGRTSVWR